MTAAGPPQDLGAERAVLGAALASPDAALTATERIRVDDFYGPAHATIFTALTSAVAERQPTDMYAIGTRLAETGELERVGGAPALHDLVSAAPVTAQVGWYAEVILRRAAQRRLATAAIQIADLAADLDRDPGDTAAIAAKLIADATATRAAGGLRPIGDLLDGALREIEAAGKHGRIPGLSTGVEHLDAMTGGLRPGQLWVVAGRPGMGKSVVGVHWAVLAALRARKRSAIFSLEMTATEVVSRVISGETGIPLARITRGRLNDDEWATVTSWSADIADAPLWIDDSAPLTLADIAARARRLHAREKLDLVVVDYLQLIKPGATGRRDRTREQEVAEITTSLKLLAKELNVPVVIMAQLNRGPEQRVEKRPVLSDMRESGSVEQDVDIALLLYREGYYKADSTKPHELELIVAKHRNGPTGTIVALDDYAHARVYDPHVAPVGGGQAF